MNASRLCKVILVLGTFSTCCHSANILGIFPFPARSHLILITSLMKELASRGHQVTVVSHFPQEKPLQNYTDIKLSFKMESIFDSKPDMFQMGAANPLFMMPFFLTLCQKITKAGLESPQLQELIHSKNQHFDIIVIESFMTEAMLGFAHKFNASIIQICPFTGDEFVGDSVGNPFPYAYAPSPFLGYTDHMTFLERLHNTFHQLYFKILYKLYHLPTQDNMMKEAFKELSDIPSVTDLNEKTSLVFLNSHISVNYAQPLLPNVVPIGGMHIKSSLAPLSKDLKTFLDNAQHGVIYFSMGSNLRSADISPPTLAAILNTFSKLKQKILWKFELDNLPGQPANVKIEKWLPQDSVLDTTDEPTLQYLRISSFCLEGSGTVSSCSLEGSGTVSSCSLEGSGKVSSCSLDSPWDAHPNLRLFMTHGGQHSTLEAIYHGVPVIGIPVIREQKLNMIQSASAGSGVVVYYENVSETSLSWALQEVLENPRYRENAKLRSKLFHDRPTTAMETAVFWTEYVARHKGAPHLRSAALDLYWFQYYLLDVIAVLLLVLTAALSTLVFMCKVIKRKLIGGSNKQVKESREKKRK
uniref:UDP-glycosyltransferase n=1 Tax=Timema genevievae TaxID=629358 RepID=A0A7R9JWA5_TIMGE|nr:unnamed protein product [Timema genevievae]